MSEAGRGGGAAGEAPAVCPAPFEPVALRTALLGWYAAHQRALPWRSSGDPYAVWISEVMLQQTRAATVEPFFRRWMARFPDIASLAAASEADVLKAWQGLGYYGRARNAARAARAVVERHGGRLPSAYDELLALPGIGSYTAGAVASIAFERRVPAVDGNVRRVLGRVLAVDDDVSRGAGARRVAIAAAALADGSSPGDVNQAIMELGATVCAPRRPACDRCPAAPWCAARAGGDPAAFPARRPRARPRPERSIAWIVADDGGRLLVARRAPRGLLGGLWEFPLTPRVDRAVVRDAAADTAADDGAPDVDLAAAADRAAFLPPAARDDATTSAWVIGPPIAHAFSHIDLTMTPVRLLVRSAFTPAVAVTPYDRWDWFDRAAVEALPLSTMMRRLLDRLDASDGSLPTSPCDSCAWDRRAPARP